MFTSARVPLPKYRLQVQFSPNPHHVVVGHIVISNQQWILPRNRNLALPKDRFSYIYLYFTSKILHLDWFVLLSPPEDSMLSISIRFLTTRTRGQARNRSRVPTSTYILSMPPVTPLNVRHRGVNVELSSGKSMIYVKRPDWMSISFNY